MVDCLDLVLLVMCKVHLYINVYLVTFLFIKMIFLFVHISSKMFNR